jgi:hypothetical protein
MLVPVPDPSSNPTPQEPPSRTADVSLGTIAMALAAFSMALLGYFI